MDFTKYVSCLENNGLYMCRANLLGDPFEGSVTQFSDQLMQAQMRSRAGDSHTKFSKEELARRTEVHIESLRAHRKKMTEEIYLNCWHQNDIESAAMWNLYAKSDEAIAITTRYSTLFDLVDSQPKAEVYVG